MKLSKIIHRKETRIRVDFAYNSLMTLTLKQIPDARWSQTIKAWHVPYTKEVFEQLKTLFPDVEYEASKPKVKEIQEVALQLTSKTQTNENKEVAYEKRKISLVVPKENEAKIGEQVQVTPPLNGITIEITNKHVFVKMPKNETDIEFLRTFKYVRWDKSQYRWVIPNYGRNLDIIKSYFGKRVVAVIEYKTDAPIPSNLPEGENPQPIFTKTDFLVINNANRILKLYFSFNKELTQQLKQIPLCKWNGDKRCWEIPYSEKFLAEIKVIAQQNGLTFIYSEEKQTKIKPRTSKHDVTNYRSCPQSYIDKLLELRYSKNTLDVYRGMFEEFINHYEATAIDDITEPMIMDFMRYLVTERHVSTSYQNQSINAIKFYYERVLGGKRKVYMIDRPREESYLPEVLNTEEITAIINATENLKHKAILMTIYSAGLRISEAVNLKIKDIDSGRMQIKVTQSKGKKDRYTLLGIKTLEILRKYVAEYKPKDWLFEGQDGEEYSRRTITEILRKSVEKAGIKKHVTVHTLRHSFATHLLETGTDIRYIQSLLGHENSKTTEIYTHITTKGFDQIKSPLDNLKIK
jgi:site-specific recombinase XerD